MRLATIRPGEPEIFAAPQGEGPTAGEPSLFIRLSQCNLQCVWCDTPYTWNFEGTEFRHADDRPDRAAKFDRAAETVDLSLENLYDRVRKQPLRRVIITGGEPLLQLRELGTLLTLLANQHPDDWTIEIETNGTIAPRGSILACANQFNVSPKLAHSGNRQEVRRRWDVLRFYGREPRAVFKFVVAQPSDLDEVDTLVSASGMTPSRTWLMPEGRDGETLKTRLAWIRPEASARGYNVSDRLHIHAHGDTRGT